MGIEIFNQFNSSFVQSASQPLGITSNAIPSLMEVEADFFDTQEGKSTATASSFLVVGLLLRKILEKMSDAFFAKYFSQKQNIDTREMRNIAQSMLASKNLMRQMTVDTKDVAVNGELLPNAELWKNNESGEKLLKSVLIEEKGSNAYFDVKNNHIRVTKDTLISLPHEIGHAVQEHSTKILKILQKYRGHSAGLALFLYGLGREKTTIQEKNTMFGKIRELLYKYNVLIPLIAFLPELITEFAASKIGIDYIKDYLKNLKFNYKVLEIFTDIRYNRTVYGSVIIVLDGAYGQKR